MLPIKEAKVVNHLTVKHNCCVTQMSAHNDAFEWDSAARNINGLDDCTWPVRILDANGTYFVFRLRVDSRRYWFCVHRVGTKSQCKSSAYEVTIHGNGRSLTFKAPTMSVADSFDEIIKNRDCFEVSQEMGHRICGHINEPPAFTGSGEGLRFRVRIWLTNGRGLCT